MIKISNNNMRLYNILNRNIPENERIHWLCTEVLHRLSVASVKEVNTWIKNNSNNLTEIEWKNNEGKYIKSFAPIDIETRLKNKENSNNKRLLPWKI